MQSRRWCSDGAGALRVDRLIALGIHGRRPGGAAPNIRRQRRLTDPREQLERRYRRIRLNEPLAALAPRTKHELRKLNLCWCWRAGRCVGGSGRQPLRRCQQPQTLADAQSGARLQQHAPFAGIAAGRARGVQKQRFDPPAAGPLGEEARWNHACVIQHQAIARCAVLCDIPKDAMLNAPGGAVQHEQARRISGSDRRLRDPLGRQVVLEIRESQAATLPRRAAPA